jgi:hypothetical protein
MLFIQRCRDCLSLGGGVGSTLSLLLTVEVDIKTLKVGNSGPGANKFLIQNDSSDNSDFSETPKFELQQVLKKRYHLVILSEDGGHE